MAATWSITSKRACEPVKRGPKVSVMYASRSHAVRLPAGVAMYAMMAAASAAIWGVGGTTAGAAAPGDARWGYAPVAPAAAAAAAAAAVMKLRSMEARAQK